MYNLINIYNASNKTLFNDIMLYDKIDKEILINTIFDEAGELEPVTSYPELLKAKIDNFFARNYTNFKHIYDAFLLEYEPIENYNRMSEITITDKGTTSSQGTNGSTVTTDNTNKTTNDLTSTRTDNLTQGTTNNLTATEANSSNSETENKVSAFNTTDYSSKDKSTVNAGDTKTATNTGTVDVTNTGTQESKGTGTTELKTDGKQVTEGNTSETGSHENTNITSDHTHGNIGVTTSQQMLQSEIDLWIKFNAYKAMTDYFIQELMITVF